MRCYPSYHPEKLHLEHNELVGSIPMSWNAMTALELLSLHHNTLDGEVPTFLGFSMRQLTDLLLNSNQLNGSIPSELGNCTTLKRLYLDENFFRGAPPDSFGNLHKLGKFYPLHWISVNKRNTLLILYPLFCHQKSSDSLAIG